MVTSFGFRSGKVRTHVLPTRRPLSITASDLVFIPPSLVKSIGLPNIDAGVISTYPFNEYENVCVHLQWEGCITLPDEGSGIRTLIRSDGVAHRTRIVWDGKATISDQTINSNGTVNQVDIFPDPFDEGCMVVAFWASRTLGKYQTYTYFDWERYRLVGDDIVLVDARWSQTGSRTYPVKMPAWVATPREAYESRYWSTNSSAPHYIYARFQISITIREQGPRGPVQLPSLRDPYRNTLEIAHDYGFDIGIPKSLQGDMARNAYLQMQVFQGNGLSYIRDIAALKNVCKGFQNLDLDSLQKGFKTLSQAYLSWHYGARLTISDTKSLISGIRNLAYMQRKMLTRKCSSSTGWYNDYMIYHSGRYAAFAPGPPIQLRQLKRLLNDFDLLPTLENGWDLIPYSFVLDWVINVEDVLQSVDLLGTYTKLGIQYSGQTVKAIKHNVLIDDYSLDLKFYHRNYGGNIWKPSIADLSVSNPFDHVIEGSALLIQRT